MVIQKKYRRNSMWTKYTFVCDPDECDALLEFTARDGYGFPNGVVRMHCPCGREMQYISVEEAYAPIINDLSNTSPVTSITQPQVVKINSNPYN
jgi:hypothetical protein